MKVGKPLKDIKDLPEILTSKFFEDKEHDLNIEDLIRNYGYTVEIVRYRGGNLQFLLCSPSTGIENIDGSISYPNLTQQENTNNGE